MGRIGGQLALFAYCFLLLAGCSGSESDAMDGSVAGQWCGAQVGSAEECVGDEVFFVELVESGAQLSGKHCEAYELECYPLLEPALQGSRLIYAYEFSGYRVDADLSLSADGARLTGTLFGTKCNCEIQITLHRL